MIKKMLGATMLAVSMGGIGTHASAAINVYVQTAPPPLRYEAVPAERRGYVWAPGNWNSRGGHYVWSSGTWMHERPGYHYHATTWVEANGRWSKQGGNWARGDRDHDGVPNGVDHHPDNSRRN